jgi:hypothetical protein
MCPVHAMLQWFVAGFPDCQVGTNALPHFSGTPGWGMGIALPCVARGESFSFHLHMRAMSYLVALQNQ